MTGPQPPDADGADPGLQTQLDALRTRLVRDAERAGIAEATVQKAIDEAANGYRAASVRSFLAVLIERDVRGGLGLPARPETALAPE
jgi:hypothetical protein